MSLKARLEAEIAGGGPISSPNICETSGAVMKSPASPSAGRVA